MEDKDFEVIKQQIDAAIDAETTGRLGIAMGFKLAGEFLMRDLLQTVRFKILVDWDAKTYRDRYVHPDPWLGDFEYRLGAE